MRLLFISIITGFLACACAVAPNLQDATTVAQQANLQHKLVPAGAFILTTYARITNPALVLHVYIEGDGAAWRSRFEPALNPTPKHALGLQLASLDKHPNVVYVARPCQFTNPELKVCQAAYWTNKRFAPEVISATNLAINQFAAQLNQPKLVLVGYSGGAALAMLAAIKRDDVVGIVTIAGNLDTESLNRYHQVSSMPESLNPADYLTQMATITQLHIVGAKDKRIPAFITQQFVAKQASQCASIVLAQDATHETGWLEQWPHQLPKLENFAKCASQ